MPVSFDAPDKLAGAVIDSVGRKIVLGLPVGIGKAVHVANALYARAVDDSSIDLTIFTALTLEVPAAGSDMERRFLEPLASRLYPDWPPLAYADAVRGRQLPENIRVREFYFRPAGYLGNELAQRAYTSLNYTQVAGELIKLGVNVIAQLVARRDDDPSCLSLSSNPEVTLDLLPDLDRRRAAGEPFALIGQVNDDMPYMYGDAEVPVARFDFLLDSPDCRYPPFGLPNRKVTYRDYATGMHVASLVPDGGTLQLGIGSLSDAVAHCLILRHREPAIFRDVLQRLPGGPASGRRPDLPLHTEPFEEGLYVATELLSDAAFALFTADIVRRGAEEGDAARLHAGFIIGSQTLYRSLRELPESRRRQIAMTSISFVNRLYGDEQSKRRQRRKARFVNETMMVTLLGSAVSDSLKDGRIISGVGGQFDFVSMAHALEDAFSILVFGSRRMHKGTPQSNVLWQYEHTTVPRHYRDVFADEYGIAATRGLCDQDVIASLLNIADSAFQSGLLATARKHGKIAGDYALPENARNNTPAALAKVFGDRAVAGHFPPYPLGTDLTPVEQQLADALSWLKDSTARRGSRLRTLLAAVLQGSDSPYPVAFERMALQSPRSPGEWISRRLLSHALKRTNTNER
jgi:acyl-CoA hydrolase